MNNQQPKHHIERSLPAIAVSREDGVMRQIKKRITKAARFAGKLSLAGAFWGVAALQPAMADVPISQQPLTVMDMIPPNIMLMLDDSGSMQWSFTPDKSYLSDTSADGLRNVGINSTYYDPNTTYSPPPKANGDLYDIPTSLTSAWLEGYATSKINCDITNFPSGSCNDALSGNSNNLSYNLYETITANVPFEDEPFPGCTETGNGAGTMQTGNDFGWCRLALPACTANSSTYTYVFQPYENRCLRTRTSNNTTTYVNPACPSGYTSMESQPRSDGIRYCTRNANTGRYAAADTSNPTCKEGTYNASKGKCIGTRNETVKLFTYTTGPKGSFVRHFVASNQNECKVAEAKYPQRSNSNYELCDYRQATQDNVKIWFSYYRNRMMLAKSGLMNAFSTMNEKFRFGWGSLHNNGGIKAPDYTSQNGYTLASVKPFGDGQTAGDHKNKFWEWIVATKPTGGTPLRLALKSIGEYYKTDQPWEHFNEATNRNEMLSCRQSYAILTTDGFWSGSTPSVGEVDDTNASNSDIIRGPNNTDYKYVAMDPFKDSNSNTLADVAMEYWKNDLKPDITTTSGGRNPVTTTTPGIPNKVPTSEADPAFWQHMVTFTIGMGFKPIVRKGNSDYELERADIDALIEWATTGTKPSRLSWWSSWPSSTYIKSNSKYNITDLVHAAVNGRGDFYQADNPQGFANGLRSALNRASERTGSAASLAANATQLDTGTNVYQAVYHTNKWTGELKAYQLDATGNIVASALWNAANKMPDAASRKIYTMNGSGSLVEFTYNNLTADQRSALDANSAISSLMVDYLRGASNDGKASPPELWRSRSNLLGDIVNSQPVFVGAPAGSQFTGRSFTGSSSFGSYASAQKNRQKTIYVAANDGMLHGFKAADGVETFAYMPSSVITHGAELGGIRQFALGDYGSQDNPHQYFNDGMLTIADVYLNGAWRTVLVGTTGRGLARSVYALDVTDPSNVTLLWERAAADGKAGSNNIGQITGQPTIAQVADGEWAVLVSNGFNSSAGQPALLQFSLADGSVKVYGVNGTDKGNGLSGPAVWIDVASSGIASTAYAGDDKGNIWHFTLGKQSDSAAQGSLVYVAKDASGNRQPITAGLTMAVNPDNGDKWVFFGTGKMLDSSDRSNTSVQTWYGLIVTSTEDASRPVTSVKTRTNLAKREIIYQDSGVNGSNPARLVTPTEEAISIDGKSGWYIDLVYNNTRLGEGMVNTNQFFDNLLVGTTRVEDSSDPCSPGGRGWVMAVNPFLGTNPDEVLFDIDGDGDFNNNDTIEIDGKKYPIAGMGFDAVPNSPTFIGDIMQITVDTGETQTVKVNLTGAVQVRSWRELVGW